MTQGRRKLLVADDSPTVRKVIGLTFGDEGAEVVAAADGAEAWRLLESGPPPDLIFADAVMPAPDGYELCERVRRDERLRHIPVVLLVGAFEPFNEAEARRVGADTVLTKPFQSIRDLVNKVGSLIGGESKEAEREEQFQLGDGPAEVSRRDEGSGRGANSLGLQDYYSPTPPPAESPRAEHADEVSAGQPATSPWSDKAPAAGSDESDPFRPNPSTSFADLGADDQMIESRPADGFSAQADARRPADAAADSLSAGASSETSFENHLRETREAPTPFASSPGNSAPATSPLSPDEMSELEPSALSSRHAFSARASAASTADDALLDLGGFDSPAPSASTAEADDFILDLADEAPAPRGVSAGVRDEPPHGGSADSVGFDDRSAFGFDPAPRSGTRAEDRAASHGNIAGDAPAGFDSDSGLLADAGRSAKTESPDFIEPTVVPADEPVPASFESEFTDGSVEGDLPKPPAAASAWSESGAPSAAVSSYQNEPAADGYAVGAARAGLGEQARAGELSPAEIEKIARHVVEMMSDEIVREIAWEVVPDLAELMVRRKLEEERK